MPIAIERLTTTSGPAFEQAAQVVHDAFEPGYIAQAISPSGEIPGLHPRRYTEIVRWGVQDLHTYVARSSPDGEVEAIMIIAPPGTPEHTPNEENPDFNEYQASLPAEVREAMDRVHKAEHEAQWRSFPDNSNLYWIAFLATSPKAQGRGLGKALLANVRNQAASEGRQVALLTQTSDNVTFYEKLGWVVTDKASDPVRGVDVTYWSLLWTPPSN